MNIINNLRNQFSYTQAELAKQSGLSLRTIQRLESRNKVPKGHTLKVLSAAFNLEPAALKEKFKNTNYDEKSEINTIQLINLSILSFIGIPFGNIIVPFILWRKNYKSKLVNRIGRQIINFQIIWWLLLCLLLVISPFISRKFFGNTQIILYVLFICYAFNVVMVFLTAKKLRDNNLNFLNIPLQLL